MSGVPSVAEAICDGGVPVTSAGRDVPSENLLYVSCQFQFVLFMACAR